MLTEVDAVALLRTAGLRVTAPRTAVLTQVHAHPHSDVETIVTEVSRELGSVSRQAVYDVLYALIEADLVRRIEPAGSPSRFEPRRGDNHHHVVCRRCGAVGDVDCAVGSAPCLDPSSTQGFVVDEAEVTFWGLCPACQVASAGSPA
jgi:Fur family ferric uptake transcriptional regulator